MAGQVPVCAVIVFAADRLNHGQRRHTAESIFDNPEKGIIALLLVTAMLFCVPAAPVSAAVPPGSDANSHAVTVHLFYGRGCPHCDKEKEFLSGLRKKYPTLTLREYEVWYDRENKALFERVMKRAGTQPAVPATVIGRNLFMGFDRQTATGIENALALCLRQECPDALGAAAGTDAGTGQEEKALNLPLLGPVNPESLSLPLFTVVIGVLDSFNPCAFFVLLFLLTMLIHVRSREKMLLVGGLFVFFSGLIYFLFMAAWLNVFLVMGRVRQITAAAGLIAIAVAVLNIKDFFFFKRGISLAIPERSRPRLFERVRNLLKSSSLPAMLGGTIVLAITANTYELLCTAGFPMVYTRTLTLHGLTTMQYYLYLALYNVVYVIPLAVIVLVMTVSLGARKLTEWQGRQLKLLSGLMMLFLGLILLVDPSLLNNALASVVLLALVVLLSAVTIAVTRKLKPDIAAENGK